MKFNRHFRSTAALGVLIAALSLVGCGNGDGADPGGTTSGGTTGGSTGGTTGGLTGGSTGGGVSGNLYVSFDGGGDVGSTDVYTGNLGMRVSSFNTGLNEGIVGVGSTLNAIGVIAGMPTLRQIANFADRGTAAFDSTQDEEFQYPVMREPKGIAFAGLTRNQLIVADAPAAADNDDPTLIPSLHVLTTLVGLVDPAVLTTIPVSVALGRSWDVAYDGVSDRLYAAMTNGTVAVYDTFIIRASLAGLGGPAVTPSRMITPGAVQRRRLREDFHQPARHQLRSRVEHAAGVGCRSGQCRQRRRALRDQRRQQRQRYRHRHRSGDRGAGAHRRRPRHAARQSGRHPAA